MRKNLFDKNAANEIISRIKKLEVSQSAKWGEMNPTEMLYHCNLANMQILEGEQDYIKPSFKQKLLRFLSLHIVPQFPKNLKGAAVNDTHGRIDAGRFDEQKNRFIEIITAFPARNKPVRLVHPSFGYLSTKQWGVAAWMHMDHHLRQFGI